MTAARRTGEVRLRSTATAGTAQLDAGPAGTPLPPVNDGAAAVEVDLPHGTSAGFLPERSEGITVDEDYLAARCWHLHGDQLPMGDSERRALDEKHKLLERTKGRPWNRDDRKLLGRLERFERARKARNLEHFRRCHVCSG